MKIKSIITLMLLMLLSLSAISSEIDLTYYNYDGEERTLDIDKCTLITSGTESFDFSSNYDENAGSLYYLVLGEVNADEIKFTNKKPISLILYDGSSLSVGSITGANHLEIFGQKNSTGNLSISGTLSTDDNLWIYGGQITANTIETSEFRLGLRAKASFIAQTFIDKDQSQYSIFDIEIKNNSLVDEDGGYYMAERKYPSEAVSGKKLSVYNGTKQINVTIINEGDERLCYVKININKEATEYTAEVLPFYKGITLTSSVALDEDMEQPLSPDKNGVYTIAFDDFLNQSSLFVKFTSIKYAITCDEYITASPNLAAEGETVTLTVRYQGDYTVVAVDEALGFQYPMPLTENNTFEMTSSPLVLKVVPAAATKSDVKYIDADGKEAVCPKATTLTNDAIISTSGWYLVEGEVAIAVIFTVTEDDVVNLILADNAELTINGLEGEGLIASFAPTLNIYAQSKGKTAGKLTTDGCFFGNKLALYGGSFSAGDLTIDESLIINNESITGFNCKEKASANSVTFKRPFVANMPATVMLPFDFYPSKIKDGAFYTLTDVAPVDGVWEASCSIITDEVIKANTPLIFKPTQIISALSFDKVEFEPTSKIDQDDGIWRFHGVYSRTDLDDLDGIHYGFAGKETEDGINVGDFIRAGEGVWVNPMRCYLTYHGDNEILKTKAATILPDQIRVVFHDEDDQIDNSEIITPISEINNESNVNVWSYNKAIIIESQPDTDYIIVDLSGRILKTGVTHSTREEISLSHTTGIVIVNINGKSFKISY